ncbi:MAG: hypothetical protein ACFFBD_00235 [Candidatus Hodarchaeota archaeon]
MAKTKNISKKSLETWQMPCFPCTKLFQCGVGQEKNPIYCEHLNDWIKENTKDSQEK